MSAATIERRPMSPVIVPRTFTLEFNCDGQTFIHSGTAHSRAEAENNARRALYLGEPGFFNARATLTRCEVVL